MKIKKTIEMKFWELMKHVAENNIKDARFEGVLCPDISIVDGSLNANSRYWFDSKHKYKVEIEENITENTEFDNLKWTYFDSRTNEIMTNGWENRSINETLTSERRCDYIEVLAIYSCDKNGILTLLWTKDNGLILE